MKTFDHSILTETRGKFYIGCICKGSHMGDDIFKLIGFKPCTKPYGVCNKCITQGGLLTMSRMTGSPLIWNTCSTDERGNSRWEVIST